jgi:hypothetical protein
LAACGVSLGVAFATCVPLTCPTPAQTAGSSACRECWR